MSTDATLTNQQQKQREFMSLMPLTVQIAGLPQSEHGRNFTESQMEARVTTLKQAYRLARQMLGEIGQ